MNDADKTKMTVFSQVVQDCIDEISSMLSGDCEVTIVCVAKSNPDSGFAMTSGDLKLAIRQLERRQAVGPQFIIDEDGEHEIC